MLEILLQHPWLTLFILSILPFFGIPLTIPAGVLLLGIDSIFYITVYSVTINILLGTILYYAIEGILQLLEQTQALRPILRRWKKWTKKKADAYVHKYGIWSLAFLTALPLPNSGGYTANVFSKILGYGFRDHFIGTVVGNIACGIISGVITFLLYLLLTVVV